MGSQLISKDILANKDYHALSANVKAALDIIQQLK
jgi:2-keto-3-deoxy-6-phosphogluconate aldolase